MHFDRLLTVHFYQHIYQNHLLVVWSYLNGKIKTNLSKICWHEMQNSTATPVTKNARETDASHRFATNHGVRCDTLSQVMSEKLRNNELTRRMELLYESSINVITKQNLMRQHKVRNCYTYILWFIIPHWQSSYAIIADKVVINMHISLPKFIQQYWNQST